ncbi:hypothetical protein I302_100879 [Kwoniella bestiolae CBS 10118]|uniref:Zinc finger FYVE domain-containing protein 19 n=1 Tax=Kwoniella bestiolae CBS 10118 TaxID=1296100 RepID=A0AAJ8K0U4_9TREE
MSDDDLFRRFAALRAPTAPLSTEEHRAGPSSPKRNVEDSARKAREEDAELERIADGRFDGLVTVGGDNDEQREDDELAKRIARLRGNDMRYDMDGDGFEGDKDVEDFLASFVSAPSHDPTSAGLPSSDDLAKDAKQVLKDVQPYIPSGEAQEVGEGDEEDDEEEETEDQIIIRALEEASLDKLHDPSDNEEVQKSTDDGAEQQNRLESLEGLSFPSLPTHIPQEEGEELDEDTKNKLNALLGLSPASHNPGQAKPQTQTKSIPKSWNLPGFDMGRDDDTDSWCCICNKDATLICLGCDDDLYCEECWRDGHGNGEGQERGHRAKRFVYKKPKQLLGAA